MNSEILKRTDVTAVTFYNSDIILIAVGGTIHLYEISSDSYVDSKVFSKGQKVHRFVVKKEHNCVVAFGGNILKLLNICQATDLNQSSLTKHFIEYVIDGDFKCIDWIQAVCWTNNNKSLAILTSHNFTQLWNIETQHKEIYQPEETCILYSGCLFDIEDTLLVFAGTVFSEVCIFLLKERTPLHTLKGHKGVIFSITWSEEHRVIATTSDDRSLKIWSVQLHDSNASPNTLQFWKNVSITCQYTLFGHTARVWRGLVTKDSVVSVGEDSRICVWSLKGVLQKKIKSHQGSCIWSIDYSPELNRVVTGGGDGAVILQPLLLLSSYNHEKDVITPCSQVAKKICMTVAGNIVCLTDILTIIYYNVAESKSYNVDTKDKRFLLLTTLDRHYFALVDLIGNIAIYREVDNSLQYFTSFETQESRVLSLHWADRNYLVACSSGGNIIVFNINSDSRDMKITRKFILIPCKERWLTAVAIIQLGGFQYFIFGDRCGNLHLYIDDPDPVDTVYKVHGHLGVNSINLINNMLMTTGRDGSIKFYEITKKALIFSYQTKVPFEWVEKIIKNCNLVCGFRESSLIIYDNKIHQEIVELNCGGGHRSWDIEFIARSHLRLCYLKNAKIYYYVINLADVVPKVVMQGMHTKEINCIQAVKINENENLIVTGSEDTSVRISVHSSKLSNTCKELIILRQLSSVRSIALEPLHSQETNKINYLIASAGGRAEIIIRMLSFPRDQNVDHISVQNVCSYMLKGTDKQRKGIKNWRNIETDFDPETRFMSVVIILLSKNSEHSLQVLDNFRTVLFTGCSDSYFRVYELKNYKDTYVLHNLATLRFHMKCILKVKWFQLHKIHFVLTMATDGIIAFWNGTEIIEIYNRKQNFSPISHFKIHKSGVNECDLYHLDDNILVIASGGDDNCVNLNIFKITYDRSVDKTSVELLATSTNDQWHCAQVTGIKFINNYTLLSASIDQRISTIFWKYDMEAKHIKVDLANQTYCDIADIHGMQLCQQNRTQSMTYICGKGLSAWSTTTEITKQSL